MTRLLKPLGDVLSLGRICGWRIATRWVLSIVRSFREVVARGDLQPADVRMSEGPFRVNFSGVSFFVGGPRVISGIREMYCRDVYLNGGLLRIENDGVVVDLGANMGLFTCLALACGARTCIAVEPSIEMNSLFWRNLDLNPGFRDRATLIRAFVGVSGGNKRLVLEKDIRYRGAPIVDEGELIRMAGDKIDFVKCDIEGGEFSLLTSDGLLACARKLAVEVHAFAGDVPFFVQSLADLGFDVLRAKWERDGSATVLAKKRE